MSRSTAHPRRPDRPWSSRWGRLARSAGIAPDERILLALSGGADSVLLLHLLAEAEPRPHVRAIHLEHGLRGEEGQGDARFCANLCRALGVPLTVHSLDLDPDAGSLEARARRARYDLLAEEARRVPGTVVVTGHHSDDVLETLLWRWIRGTPVAGLRGPRGRTTWLSGDVRIVRPLLPLRREEVRRLLFDRGLTWREDGSNTDRRFTRNRLRHAFLPFVERVCGPGAIENLHAFGRAVEGLEEGLAAATAHLIWGRAPYAPATRGTGALELGGVLPRAELMRLAPPLRRRALWRLLCEGTGRGPGRVLQDHLLDDLASGRCTRHALPGDWTLLLRSDELHLLPPRPAENPADLGARELGAAASHGESWLPFPSPDSEPPGDSDSRARVLRLSVPGIVSLPDGRRVSAELVRARAHAPAPRGGCEVELDAAHLPGELEVRGPRPGDRFQGLGAPGSKPLLRFLADRGIPREERPNVLVVCADDLPIWVAGMEPAHRFRLRPGVGARLRLTLHHDRIPRLDAQREVASLRRMASSRAVGGRREPGTPASG